MKLKPGQYTPVIPMINPTNHQPYAYMIVKLIAKEPAGQRDLNDPRVQQAIRQQLRDRREQLLKAAYYETLRDDAKGHELLCRRNSKEPWSSKVNTSRDWACPVSRSEALPRTRQPHLYRSFVLAFQLLHQHFVH